MYIAMYARQMVIRKQVYIEERHDRLLKRRAKQSGVTEAEIIRDALDGLDRGQAHSRRLDPEAGRAAIAFMRSLAGKRKKSSGGQKWSRDSLYEDRIGRWTKS